MAFSFDLGLAISAERYGAISAGPEHNNIVYRKNAYNSKENIIVI